MEQLHNIIQPYKIIVQKKLNNLERGPQYIVNDKIQVTKWHIQHELISKLEIPKEKDLGG